MHMSGSSADKWAEASFISQPRPREANGSVRSSDETHIVLLETWFFARYRNQSPATPRRSLISVLNLDPNGTTPGEATTRDSSTRRIPTGDPNAPSRTRSKLREPEVAGSIEHQRTINVLLGNVDTLAQIPRYIVTTSRLTEIGRSDVKLSQVDPRVCQFRRGYYTIARQHRIRYGRFSGLVD